MRHAICIEASHEKGMGHLFRGLTLARALKSLGDSVVMIANRDERTLSILSAAGFETETIDSYAESGWEEAIIERRAPETWINDRLDTTAAHAKIIKRRGIMLAVLDDNGEGAASADLNIRSLDVNAAPNDGSSNRYCGPDYMILNPNIINYRGNTRTFKQPLKLLVSLGGSDTHGVTPRVLAAAAAVRGDFMFTAVIGPNYRHEKELEEAIDSFGGGVAVLRSVPDLISVIAGSDLMVTNAGVTLYEAASMGVPAVAIANEAHEKPIGARFETVGACVFLGGHDEGFEGIIAGRLKELSGNAAMLRAMSAAGKALVDGNGIKRVTDLLRRVHA